jgi:hypothetical protein
MFQAKPNAGVKQLPSELKVSTTMRVPTCVYRGARSHAHSPRCESRVVVNFTCDLRIHVDARATLAADTAHRLRVRKDVMAVSHLMALPVSHINPCCVDQVDLEDPDTSDASSDEVSFLFFPVSLLHLSRCVARCYAACKSQIEREWHAPFYVHSLFDCTFNPTNTSRVSFRRI